MACQGTTGRLPVIFGGEVAVIGSLLSQCFPQESSLGMVGITHLGIVRGHLSRYRPGGSLRLGFQGSLASVPAGIVFFLQSRAWHNPTPHPQGSILTHCWGQLQCFRHGGVGARGRDTGDCNLLVSGVTGALIHNCWSEWGVTSCHQ